MARTLTDGIKLLQRLVDHEMTRLPARLGIHDFLCLLPDNFGLDFIFPIDGSTCEPNC